MTTALQRRTRQTLAWVIAIPLLLGLVSFWAAGRYRSSIRWVYHTEEVIIALQDLLTAITDAESSQRGFLLTGDWAFRTHYARMRDQVPGKLAHLQELTQDNGRQQDSLRQLSASIQARITDMERVLALRQQGHLPAAEAVAVMRQGGVRMAHIRQICEEMQQEEMRLLAIRTRTQRSTEIEVALSFLLGMALGVALLSEAHRLIRQYGAMRDQAEQDLQKVNIALEARVQERTAEWEAANVQLRRSNADLTQFAYVASHDLQEPLRTVGIYTQMLLRRVLPRDPEAERYAGFIRQGVRRMEELIRDLLSYSRTLQADEQPRRTADLSEVLAQTLALLQDRINETGAVITSEPLPVVAGDNSQLTLVFQNLLSNSLKYRRADVRTEIHLSAVRQGHEWVISVHDNGIGFEPQYAERIFGLFKRLHKDEYPGTGLGLAICQRILERSGGRIWAEGRPGEGATFFLALPGREGE
jgi:signal transduction histidine kinase